MHNTKNKWRIGKFIPALIVITALPTVMAGRASAQDEYTLIGIPLGASSTLVVKKYGNPTQVQVNGHVASKLTESTGASSSSGSPSGFGGQPGGGGGQEPGGGASDNSGDTGNGGPTDETNAGGQQPGGYGAPGGYGTPGATTAPAKKYAQVVVWRYDRPDGTIYQFIIHPSGRVLGIDAVGYHGAARTSRGITLGQSYSQVVAKYGFPDSQLSDGPYVMADYSKSHDVTFTFYKQSVFEIMVSPLKTEKIYTQSTSGNNGPGGSNGSPYGGSPYGGSSPR